MRLSKYAVFAFESEQLPDALKILDRLEQAFLLTPSAAMTQFIAAHSMEDAALAIDTFKAQGCGSALDLAAINLNRFPSAAELRFLLSGPVLGNPLTVFQGSLRALQGPIYQVARDKVEAEVRSCNEGAFGATSCIDSYTTDNRDEAARRVADYLDALVHEKETAIRCRQTGVPAARFSEAREQMLRSPSTYAGKRRMPTGRHLPVR